jgi:hypothetical protein
MVQYIPAYDELVRTMLTSEGYTNGTPNERQAIKKFLNHEKIKKYFENRVFPIPETLHEIFSLGITNSDVFNGVSSSKQEKITHYLDHSRGFKKTCDAIENSLEKLLEPSNFLNLN